VWQHHAVLAKQGRGDEPEGPAKLGKDEVESLLKQGAYQIFMVRLVTCPCHTL
jgi:hypothetical protein